MYETLRNLGLENFVIRFNNRKILNGLSEVAGFDKKKALDVFRVLDKLEKLGLEEVIKELRRQPENEYDDTALAIPEVGIAKIKEFLAFSDKSDGLIEELKDFFKGIKVAQKGIKECEEIINNLRLLRIPEKNWKFDLAIARGLGYYTGPVFETILTDLPEIGSIFSGGRYDELVMRYTGEKIPATGASDGVDRLIAALEKLGKIEKKTATAKVLLTILDKNLTSKILQISQKLRQAKISNEIYLVEGKTLKEQIIYAVKRGIPFVIMLGDEEIKAGKVKLRDMDKREEFLLTEEEIIAKLLQQ